MWMFITLASAAPGMDGNFFKTASAAAVALVTVLAAWFSFGVCACKVASSSGKTARVASGLVIILEFDGGSALLLCLQGKMGPVFSFSGLEENPVIPKTLEEVEVLIFDNPVAHIIQEGVVGFWENKDDIRGQGGAENGKHGCLGMDDCIGGSGFCSGEKSVELFIHAGEELLLALDRKENGVLVVLSLG